MHYAQQQEQLRKAIEQYYAEHWPIERLVAHCYELGFQDCLKDIIGDVTEEEFDG